MRRRARRQPATLSSARGHEESDSAVCSAGDEGAFRTRLRRPGFHHAIVEGVARGDGEMFLRKYERTCNFPPLDRTGPRDKGSRSRNVRSRCRCSLSPAIRISSRGWPRSSSTDEPSDPPSRVFSVFGFSFYMVLVLGVYERGLKKGTDERKGCCTELASGLGTARGGLLSRLRGRRRTVSP